MCVFMDIGCRYRGCLIWKYVANKLYFVVLFHKSSEGNLDWIKMKYCLLMCVKLKAFFFRDFIGSMNKCIKNSLTIIAGQNCFINTEFYTNFKHG